MLSLYLFAFASACVWTALSTPVVRALAVRRNVLDWPNHRKVHTRSVPRLGGVALGVGTLLAAALTAAAFPAARALFAAHAVRLGGLAAGAVILCAVGVLDDVRRKIARLEAEREDLLSRL